MKKSTFAGRAFCAVLASVFLVSVVNADIGYFGQVSPTDPSSWTLSTSAMISTGTVSVDGGDDIESNLGLYWRVAWLDRPSYHRRCWLFMDK